MKWGSAGMTFGGNTDGQIKPENVKPPMFIGSFERAREDSNL